MACFPAAQFINHFLLLLFLPSLVKESGLKEMDSLMKLFSFVKPVHLNLQQGKGRRDGGEEEAIKIGSKAISEDKCLL